MVKQHQPESKIEELCNYLRDMARSKGPHAQMPTMRVLCDELKTTRVTLGEALRQLEAEGVLYSKDRQGIFVSSTVNQKCIHILFNEAYLTSLPLSPFWSILWMRLEQEAEHRRSIYNERYVFHTIMPPPQQGYQEQGTNLYSFLNNTRVDGIISISMKNGERYHMPSLPAPCVTFAEEGDWIVKLATGEVGILAAQMLLRQNCKHMSFWVTNEFSGTIKPETPLFMHYDEARQFHRVLTENNMPIYDDFLRQAHIPPSLQTLSLQEQGYLLAHEVFSTHNGSRPDGLFINDDMLTDGALVALDELGVKVGEDVKIVSQANIGSPILFGRTGRLTIVEFDPTQIVTVLFSILDGLMAGQTPPVQATSIRPRLRT